MNVLSGLRSFNPSLDRAVWASLYDREVQHHVRFMVPRQIDVQDELVVLASGRLPPLQVISLTSSLVGVPRLPYDLAYFPLIVSSVH